MLGTLTWRLLVGEGAAGAEPEAAGGFACKEIFRYADVPSGRLVRRKIGGNKPMDEVRLGTVAADC